MVGQLFDFIQPTRSARTPVLAAIIFRADQFPVPNQQRLWRDDSGQVTQHATAELRGFDCQTPALVTIQVRPVVSKLLAQRAVFLLEVLNNILLPVLASGQENQPQTKSIQCEER